MSGDNFTVASSLYGASDAATTIKWLQGQLRDAMLAKDTFKNELDKLKANNSVMARANTDLRARADIASKSDNDHINKFQEENRDLKEAVADLQCDYDDLLERYVKLDHIGLELVDHKGWLAKARLGYQEQLETNIKLVNYYQAQEEELNRLKARYEELADIATSVYSYVQPISNNYTARLLSFFRSDRPD